MTEEPSQERSVPPWRSHEGEKLTDGTGFFRTFETDGRWWLVDPEGKAFFDIGTDHCRYSGHWCEKLGYAPYGRNMETKYGSEDAWAGATTQRLLAWSFNTVAAGHSESTRYRGLAHINFASFGSSFAPRDWICEPINWTGFPNVFSPAWERHCRIVARRMAGEQAEDPWLIGTFLDNELEWYGKQGYLVDEVFKLAPDHTAKVALWDWLVQRYGGLEGINQALNTDYANLDGFLAPTDSPAGAGMAEVRVEFLKVIAERYFSVACGALREADPDHLIMGCRFAGVTPEPVLEIASRHNDVFTLNTYPRVDIEQGRVLDVPDQLRHYFDIVGKPMIITEWSFPALDSGLPCKHGAGMRVDTQAQKAQCYEAFANMVADLPFMVGYHYFMWVDEPALGIASTFPEDSNYGLVNEQDEPYEEFVTVATRVNAAAAERHARSILSGDIEAKLVGEGVELSNPGDLPARGAVLISSGGETTSRDITLEPGESLALSGPGGQVDFALVRNWDGEVTRLVAPCDGSPVIVNTGLSDVVGLPMVVDSSPPVAVVLDRLPAGAVRRPEPARGQGQETTELDAAGGGTTWEARVGQAELFSRVTAGQLELGRVIFATHQVIGGQNQWVETSALESLTVHEQPGATVIDAVVSRAGEGEVITRVDGQGRAEQRQAGPGRFRACVRAAVFQDLPVALVRPLWVESLDDRPWTFVSAFVFCRPSIGGATERDVVGGVDVPNYYLGPVGLWTDEALGGAFGAVGRSGEWEVTFWQSEGGMYHPDARHKVDAEMTRGKRIEFDAMQHLWVFGLETADGWRDLANRCRQAGALLVGGI